MADLAAQIFSSAAYWRRRYMQGRNSGAGSYGRLAQYKADYINALVATRGIRSVVEFGSGDGNQAALFTLPRYTGVDISRIVLRSCRERFANRRGWAFIAAEDFAPQPHDMAMSLDVIYHLVEDEVYHAYMQRLFDNAQRFVLIYASDVDVQVLEPHVRHRAFSDWIATHRPGWALLDAPDHPFPMTDDSDPATTSFASFKLYGAAP